MMLLFSKSDIVQPYAQGVRIIIKNSMLWVMFLPCMATSVFFSFDSRFHVIFPADQRVRAAEIPRRTRLQRRCRHRHDHRRPPHDGKPAPVRKRRLKAYDAELEKLSKASEGADALVEAHFTKQMEAHRASVAEQQSVWPQP